MKTLPWSLVAVLCALLPAVRAAPPPAGLATGDWSGIRQAHAAWQRSFREAPGGFASRHPEHRWRSTFDSRGFTASSDDGGWQWGLELSAWGFPGCLAEVTDPAGETVPDGTRLTRTWDDALQEWYVNDAGGLEHGFTILHRPAGGWVEAQLIIEMTLRGNLRPQLHSDGLAATFVETTENPVLTYGGLKVWDALGRILPAHMRLSPAGRLRFEIAETDALYPLTVDPVAAPVYVKAHNPGARDRFGFAVAISGDTVVVGAPFEDGDGSGVNPPDNDLREESGAVYVFVRTNGVWSQQAYLKASSPTDGDLFGRAVAVSGDTIIVGANLEDGSGTGINPPPNETADQAGAAYIFVRNGTTWSQQAYLKASNAGVNDHFGIAVAISGDTAAVGAHLEDGSGTGVNSQSNEDANGSGAVYVFGRNAGWTQQAYIKASNTGGDDSFGFSLALSGDTLVVGAPLEDGSGSGVNPPANEDLNNSGAAYIFFRNGAVWVQHAYLKASNPGADDHFGVSVAVSGDTAVVGADGEDGSAGGVNPPVNEDAPDAGAAYVFVQTESAWVQQAWLKALNSGANDLFGSSIAASGDLVLVGAPREDGGGLSVNPTITDVTLDSGAAYSFHRTAGVWSMQNYVKATNTRVDDQFGFSVGISGDTAVIGAQDEDGSGSGINPPNGAFLAAAGAAYIYTRQAPLPDQDSDGLVDVLEVYFGTDPAIPNASPLTVSYSAGQLHLRWPEANTAGVTVIPQWSPDVITWLADGESHNGIPARSLPVVNAGGNLKEASLSAVGLTRADLRLKLTCQ